MPLIDNETGEEIPFTTPKINRKGKKTTAQPEVKKRKWKRKAIKYILIITIIAGSVTYGLTRPGVVTNIKSGVKYLSPSLQKKAWNEAKREVLESDKNQTEQELEKVRPQSFWNQGIIHTALASDNGSTADQEDGDAGIPDSNERADEANSVQQHGNAGTPPKQLAQDKPAVTRNGIPYINDSKEVYAEFDKQAAQKLTAEQARLFKRVCEAETGMRMVPNSAGASSAYGPCQLLKVHDKRAQKLGYSNRNESLEANIATSIDLFLEQGTTPWNESKHMKNCKGWGDNPANCNK